MLQCARNRLDTADIVRDACLHHLAEFLLAMALLTIRSIDAISRESVSVRRVPCSFPLGEKHLEQIIGNLLCGGFVF
jgi:hypothetical protein